MKRKTIAGLIAVVVVVAVVVFAGGVEEKTSHTPRPTSPPLPYKIMRS